MPCLAADADAIIQRHVVAKANDLVQRGRAIANQGRTLDRVAQLAVLDQIRLGAAEHELARDNIHLPAAKTFGEDAVFDAAEQLSRIIIAAAHEGVGHPRHGCMGVAFTAAIARGRNTHQPRVHAVLHVRAQDAIFDQDIFLRWRAFVVNRQRSAPVLHRAIINDGDAGRSDALADLAGKSAAALAVEIAFKAMADRLVQQYTGPAGSEQNGHFARWRRDRSQIGQRLRQCDVDRMFPFMLFEQLVVEIAAAKAVGAGFTAVAILRHDGNVEPHQRPHIGRDKAVGAHNLDNRPAARKPDADLRNTRVARARGGVDLLAQGNLLRERHQLKRVAVGVQRPVVLAWRRCGLFLGRIKQLQRFPRTADGGLAHVIGVAEPRHLARHTAQAKARPGRIIGHLQTAIVKAETFGCAILEIKFPIVARLERLPRNALRCVGVKQARLVEIGARVCVGHGVYMGRCCGG